MSAANPPAWLGWSLGLGGTALLAAALFRMTPPYRRRRSMTGRVLPALGIFLLFALTAGPSSGQLVLGGGGFAVAALPLFWMGKLPADMPSAKDPGIGSHPDHPRVARRGRIAGIAIVILEIAWITTYAVLS
ncbi:hypothetical protein [Winogradskya humida]|uniref:Uncharacterized protein n=1 Tax=Winogradskya humida TaxID=113566 RepID=A0ABQ3ZZC1_9ACTN|nr:hypothetical protein [Actinoplanes humidus]GIE23938.1 hypothetical protein Ahu01nite_070400 [Actinoplanes humidus]